MPIYSSPDRTGTRILLRLTFIRLFEWVIHFYNIKFLGFSQKSARDRAADPPFRAHPEAG